MEGRYNRLMTMVALPQYNPVLGMSAQTDKPLISYCHKIQKVSKKNPWDQGKNCWNLRNRANPRPEEVGERDYTPPQYTEQVHFGSG